MLRAIGASDNSAGGKTRRSGRGAGQGRNSIPPETAQTWDPLRITAPGTTLSNGDKTGAITTNPRWLFSTGSKAAASAGKRYFEVVHTGGAGDSFYYIGVAETGTASNGGVPANAIMQRGNGNFSTAGGTAGSAWADGSVIGIAIDFSTGVITAYKDNVANGVGPTKALTGNQTIAVANTASAAARTFVIRTTAAEFSYTPPSGYTAWGAA